MEQPKDHAPRNVMHNTDTGMIFRVINGVLIVLIAATLIWTASTLTTLTTQVAVLISQTEANANEFSRIDRRITELERYRVNSSTNGNE